MLTPFKQILDTSFCRGQCQELLLTPTVSTEAAQLISPVAACDFSLFLITAGDWFQPEGPIQKLGPLHPLC